MKQMMRSEAKLGEILIRKGWISPEQLDQALRAQKFSREFLGTILVKQKTITEDQRIQALSEQFGISCTNLKNYHPDWNWIMKFSAALILEHQCFPVRQEKERVTFAITNPLDAWALAKAEEEAHGYDVHFALVPLPEIHDMLEEYQKRVNERIRKLLNPEM